MKLSGLILFDFDSDRISVKLSVRQLWPGNGSVQGRVGEAHGILGHERVLIVKVEVQFAVRAGCAGRVRSIKQGIYLSATLV